MFRRSVKSADLAAVFLDSLEGGRLGRSSDTMGGLEYEEFWQAFVRLVLRLNDGGWLCEIQLIPEKIYKLKDELGTVAVL